MGNLEFHPHESVTKCSNTTTRVVSGKDNHKLATSSLLAGCEPSLPPTPTPCQWRAWTYIPTHLHLASSMPRWGCVKRGLLETYFISRHPVVTKLPWCIVSGDHAGSLDSHYHPAWMTTPHSVSVEVNFELKPVLTEHSENSKAFKN